MAVPQECTITAAPSQAVEPELSEAEILDIWTHIKSMTKPREIYQPIVPGGPDYRWTISVHGLVASSEDQGWLWVQPDHQPMYLSLE